MTEKLEVKLFTQSFMESGGPEVFPDLESLGTVATGLSDGEMSNAFHNKNHIDEHLIHQAKKLGGSHIFKAEYDFKENAIGELSVYKATGTAYGSRN